MKNLYKPILTLMVWALAISTVQAQMFSQRNNRQMGTVEYGIIGGLHFADFTGNGARFANITGYNVSKMDPRLTGNVGLFASIFLDKSVAIQPEAVLSFRGAKQKIEGGDLLYRMSYLHVPLFVKGIWNTETGVSPYIMAGPSVSFLLSDKYKFDTNASKATGNLNGLGLNTRNTLYELNFGAGVQFGPLMVEGRYQLGLNDAFKNVKEQHSIFAINIGFALNPLYE